MPGRTLESSRSSKSDTTVLLGAIGARRFGTMPMLMSVEHMSNAKLAIYRVNCNGSLHTYQAWRRFASGASPAYRSASRASPAVGLVHWTLRIGDQHIELKIILHQSLTSKRITINGYAKFTVQLLHKHFH